MADSKNVKKTSSKSNVNIPNIVTEDDKRKEEIKELMQKYPQILQIFSVVFKEPDSFTPHPKSTVRCLYNIQIKTLVREVIYKDWKLKSPRIVVLFMSNVGPLHSWTNAKQIKSFQKGLMKAAENTDMWVMTNGLDIGTTSIVGEGVSAHMTESKYRRLAKNEQKRGKFHFIGIADEDMVKNINKIKTSEDLQIELESTTTTEDKYDLCPNLSQYIILKDETTDKSGTNTFLMNFIKFLSSNQKDSLEIKDNTTVSQLSLETNEIPVVTILMRGGYNTCHLVLDNITNNIPIVVFRGSGGLADLIAFVEMELRDRCLDHWDTKFVETHLKPELTIRILKLFPKYGNNLILCSLFEDRILDCVQSSRKDGRNYLTVINLFDRYSTNLENLTEYLLSALFKTQKDESVTTDMISSRTGTEVRTKMSADIIRQDLKLCIDWNCPQVAKKDVIAKDPTFPLNDEKKLFEKSLITKNRSDFVDLFLSQKFKLRTFVSPKRLRRMFRKIHSHDFFSTVCWETILNRSPDQKQSDEFIFLELNWLTQSCTGVSQFFEDQELELYVTGQLPYSEKEAERKALEMIVLWAVFDFRKTLVRTLWRHSDRPIHLALIIAMAYDRLQGYCTEEIVKEDLKSETKIFIGFAYKVLDKCFKESTLRTENVLNECSQHWEYRTAVDLAAFARFRSFFSHPSVQKFLTTRFYGNIVVKDLLIRGFGVPRFIKLFLSAYLVFPMFFWIRVTSAPVEEEDMNEDDEDETQIKPKTNPNDPKSLPKDPKSLPKEEKSNEMKSQKKNTKPNFLSDIMNGFEANRKTGIITLIYEVWTAPITKFWNFQFFYSFYLSVFSIAVLYPRRGNFYLDLLICIWTLLLLFDDIRQTYIYRVLNINSSIGFRIIEIVLRTIFLWLYFMSRVLNGYNNLELLSPYSEKVIICLALLHAYYVLFTVFLPISATLGPLLYRLKIMILVDFINFIRLSILVMISFGIVMQSILYPDMSLNFELFRQTFHRAFFTLFGSPDNELLPDRSCVNLTLSASDQRDRASIYSDENCRVTGVWPYIFMIAYLVLLKLIMITLLFALFSMSAVLLTQDTDSIWKFQRYGLVMDIVTRAPLPPPLNVFYYIYWIIRQLIGKCCPKENINKSFETPNQIRDWTTPQPMPHKESKLLEDDEYTYLRILASEVFVEFEESINSEAMAAQHFERTKANSEELEYQRKAIRQMKGNLAEIQRSIGRTNTTLEANKNLTKKTEFREKSF